MTKDSPKQDIANAASTAVKTISQAAEAAAKVVAEAAAEAVKVTNTKGADDHDLLVELKVKMEGLKNDIKDLNDGTTRRINNLETDKLSIRDSYSSVYKAAVEENFKNHEIRLNALETVNTRTSVLLTIGIGILSLLTSILVYHLVGK